MTTVSAPGRPRPVTPLGLAAARLEEALALVDGPAAALVREAHALVAGVDPYLERHTSPASPALAALAAATADHDWTRHGGVPGSAPVEQEMLSGHVEGQLLRMLVHATRARRVLEVGLFTGYSALAMAEALPADGVVVACELDPEVAALARTWLAASPAGRLVDVRVGPAADTLAALPPEPFDLVFVDADKGGYRQYLDLVLDRGLLAPHGLLCVDNTLLQGGPWTQEPPTGSAASIASFNEALRDDPRVEQVLLPLRDGVTLVRRVAG